MKHISYNHEKPNYLLIIFIVIASGFSIYLCLLKNPNLLVQTPLREGLNSYEKPNDLIANYNKLESSNSSLSLSPNNFNQIALNKSHSFLFNNEVSVNFPYPDSWSLPKGDEYNFYFSSKHLITANTDKNSLYITHLENFDSWQLEDKKPKSSDVFLSAKGHFLYWLSHQNNINLFDMNSKKLIWARGLQFQKLQKMHTDNKNNLVIIAKKSNDTHFIILDHTSGKVKTNLNLKSQETILQIADNNNEYYLYGEENIYKINKANGEILWRRASFASINNNIILGRSSIYIATTAGQMVSINSKNGEKNWEYNADQPFEGNFTFLPIFNRVSAMSQDGYIHTLDAVTGETRWRLKIKKSSTNSDILSVKLNSSTIMKLKLPWKYKAWTLWSQCAQRSICILNPDNGQVIAKYSNTKKIIKSPHFIDGQFVLLSQESSSLNATSLHYYSHIKK